MAAILLASVVPVIWMSTADVSSADATGPACTPYEVLLAHADGAVTVEGSSSTQCSSTQFFGSMAGQKLNQPIVGMASTPNGGGYWLVAADGGIFTFGNAQFYGSTGNIHLNKPIVGMATTPDGGGYWLVASDGGIFTFGDAKFYGSMGATVLNKPVVGMASDGSTGGYWLAASDGGIFAFNAPFLGSLGGKALNAPIQFVTGTPSFDGYRMVGSDGGVFDFGDAQFFGSAASAASTGWDALATTPDGGGYWLFGSTGTAAVKVSPFGDAAPSVIFEGGESSAAPIVGAASLALNQAPQIATEPASETVAPGGGVSFSASATGQPAPTVQWQVSINGGVSFSNVSGATGDTLTFSAAQSENGWQYQAVFSNSVGSATTTVATLSVEPPGDTTPSSAGGTFRAVSCPSSTDCVAVGETSGGLALIERSTNGGATFITSPVPSAAPLMEAVDCNDTSHCVAVGPSAALVSDDGGVIWAQEAVPFPVISGETVNYDLAGVACQSDLLCTAVGTEVISGSGGGLENPIYIYSTDGGMTWTSDASPPYEVAGSVACTSSYCVSAGEGLALSSDGGQTWTIKGISGGASALLSISCTTSGTSCLAVSTNTEGMSTPTLPGQLVVSTNSGSTWTNESTNLPASTATIQTISCGGSTDCVTVGPSPSDDGTFIGASTVNNGGAWTYLSGGSGFTPSQVAEQVPFPDVACGSSTSCVVVSGNSSGPAVAHTGNAGGFWTAGTVQ